MTPEPHFVHTPPAVFRGEREYVHSTDLYEEVTAGAGIFGLEFDGPIDFRIRERITRSPCYEFNPDSPKQAGIAASCSFFSKGDPWSCSILEGDQPVLAKKPYDESAAKLLAKISGRRIELRQETGLRPVETVTALAVAVHNSALQPGQSKRWMLARLSLDRPLHQDCTHYVSIQIDRVVGRTMTQSKIFDQRGEMGSMTFLLAELVGQP